MKYNKKGESRIEISDILDYFKDINSMYNDCLRHDSLKRMFEDLVAETREDVELERKTGEWIPCVDGNEPKANAECWISTNAKYVRRATYAPGTNNQPNGFIVTVGSFGFYEYGKSAKAWMPYTQEPEPYKEGEQDG